MWIRVSLRSSLCGGKVVLRPRSLRDCSPAEVLGVRRGVPRRQGSGDPRGSPRHLRLCARALSSVDARHVDGLSGCAPERGGTSGSCALPAASCGRACYLWPSGHRRRPQCGVACRTCGRRLVWPALVAARKGEKGACRPAPSPDSAPRLSAISMRRAGRGLEIPRADVCSEDLHRARACDVLTIEVRSAATGAPTLGPIQADGRRVRGLQAIAQRVVHLSFPISAASAESGPSSGS